MKVESYSSSSFLFLFIYLLFFFLVVVYYFTVIFKLFSLSQPQNMVLGFGAMLGIQTWSGSVPSVWFGSRDGVFLPLPFLSRLFPFLSLSLLPFSGKSFILWYQFHPQWYYGPSSMVSMVLLLRLTGRVDRTISPKLAHSSSSFTKTAFLSFLALDGLDGFSLACTSSPSSSPHRDLHR